MAGVRRRLLPLRMITTDASSYGSDNYGDKTYGTRASDTADLQPYIIVPKQASATDMRLSIRRVTDTDPPFECWIVATGTLYDDVAPGGERMSLSTVEQAYIRFTEIRNPGVPTAYQMEITGDLLRYDFQGGEFLRPGPYRVNVMLFFDSGRRMSVAGDDSQLFTVLDSAGV